MSTTAATTSGTARAVPAVPDKRVHYEPTSSSGSTYTVDSNSDEASDER